MNLAPYDITTTSLDIIIEEIEPVVGPYRTKYTPSGAKGCPSHFTLLYPFIHPQEINEDLLNELKIFFGEVEPFSYSFEKIDFFPKVAFLLPNPRDKFEELTWSLMRKFPQFKPYGADFKKAPLPHCTFAQHDDEMQLKVIANEFEKNDFKKLPKSLRVSHVYMTFIENGYSILKYKFNFKNEPIQ